ncbi:MAG: class I SAM-dependent methyltransferase [Deferribacteres bacterium]|nr:class I SAM-dependent methyltransferase [candidate division KSB1 bacterium]MCB9502376.1 class I SAM-dependent methyltransferase [Deferribacteres bacterium]
MHLSIRFIKLLFRFQKFIPVRNLLAKQFYKPEGLWGRIAVDFMAVANRPVYKWTIDLLEIKQTDFVLEIGFGHGIYIEKVAQLADLGFVAGVDFSQAMVKRAMHYNRHLIRHKKVEILQNGMQDIPYADAFFDCAFAVNVIYFWHTPENELREMCRVLKPGGRAAFYFSHEDSLRQLPFTDNSLFRNFSCEEFTAIVKNAGFAQAICHTRIFQFKDAALEGHCVVAVK